MMRWCRSTGRGTRAAIQQRAASTRSNGPIFSCETNGSYQIAEPFAGAGSPAVVLWVLKTRSTAESLNSVEDRARVAGRV